MSQTCHCCNQLSGDCNFDFCSPWVFSLAGPQPSMQQPFYTDKFYSIKTEFNFNSFIWTLNPELRCDDPIYDSGTGSNTNGGSEDTIELMISKVFYIDPKSNINIQYMMENTVSNNIGYKIQMKPLLKQCFYCRQCCSDTGSGICFNIPVAESCYGYCESLYDIRGIKTMLPSIKYDGVPNKDCSKKYTYSEGLIFNTESYGPFWLLTIHLRGYVRDYYGSKLGFKNTGAFSINGIKSSFCNRFSRLMITSLHDLYSTSLNTRLSCFSDSFFSEGENDEAAVVRGPRVLNFGGYLETQSCNYNREDIIYCENLNQALDGPIMALNGSYSMRNFGWDYFSNRCSPFIYTIID
jgi:hypothetical protein